MPAVKTADMFKKNKFKEKMMNKKVAKKNYVFYAKRVLGEVLRLEANSTSCTLFYEPKQPENIAKFKRKTK